MLNGSYTQTIIAHRGQLELERHYNPNDINLDTAITALAFEEQKLWTSAQQFYLLSNHLIAKKRYALVAEILAKAPLEIKIPVAQFPATSRKRKIINVTLTFDEAKLLYAIIDYFALSNKNNTNYITYRDVSEQLRVPFDNFCEFIKRIKEGGLMKWYPFQKPNITPAGQAELNRYPQLKPSEITQVTSPAPVLRFLTQSPAPTLKPQEARPLTQAQMNTRNQMSLNRIAPLLP